MIPANFAVYLGNVSHPQGIPRNRTARRNRRSKKYKAPPEQEKHTIDLEHRVQAPQRMEARDIALDRSITDKLPSNARIIRASDNGLDHQCRSIRFDTRAPAIERNYDGLYKTYFLKLLPGDSGRDIMRGEYNSSKAIYDIVPYFLPRPIAWGTLVQDKNLHFFICDFHEMDSQVVNTDRFMAALTKLHQKSAVPGTKFGFHVSTFIHHFPQNNRETETWEEYFSINFRQFLELEKEVHGPPGAAFSTLSKSMLSRVIPRLLRPMETDGRRVTPVILHGDLSLNNTSTSLQSHSPIVYNACAFFGHNEYDIRELVLGKFGAEYLEAYQKILPASEPKADFEDRMALYGLRSLLHESCLRPGDKRVRQQLVERMKVLVEKYPGGYQGYVNTVSEAETATPGKSGPS